ncbi:pyridoxamine 5'-phosphate oxidase family protein [Methylobacillus arboreus]|uniref:pyridoxamine 5'-phosphate oxidase family protein n=1 Tax=Methylobacillus arboreus TaxID=755170 RepID=UPI001E3CA108|nr:pyridoxamine 5'-phosphate oxidase family protein [Methylobacillus arboreus]MCB5190912.1 pyridoxamine 5'-phosphate oxidase family protein [Methylobacillus arboreus]
MDKQQEELYGPQHLALQQDFDTVKLAAAVHNNIVSPQIEDVHKAFIESRDMFFLSTIDHRGYPTCSYKGGSRGFIKVLDEHTLAYPSYDGNGMFLSMGNITRNRQIGMLLIDFEVPHRIRIHGDASIDRDDPLMAEYAEAEMVVRVKVKELFVNCSRYVHRFQRVADSDYVPKHGKQTRLPQWKRIDGLQEALPPRDQHIAEALGGTITPEEYEEMVRTGSA